VRPISITASSACPAKGTRCQGAMAWTSPGSVARAVWPGGNGALGSPESRSTLARFHQGPGWFDRPPADRGSGRSPGRGSPSRRGHRQSKASLPIAGPQIQRLLQQCQRLPGRPAGKPQNAQEMEYNWLVWIDASTAPIPASAGRHARPDAAQGVGKPVEEAEAWTTWAGPSCDRPVSAIPE